MAIKILKHGTAHYYQTECDECDCVFIYQSIDIQRKQGKIDIVECPECHWQVMVQKKLDYTGEIK